MTNFDPKGTAPGLTSSNEPKQKVVSLKCKSDTCSSIQAIEVTPEVSAHNAGAPHYRTYQCVKCQVVWTVPTGGFVSL